GKLVGNSEIDIARVADIENAGEGEIAFSEKSQLDTDASCVIVGKSFDLDRPYPYIIVDDPKLAFALIAEVLHPPKYRGTEIHSTATISNRARIGANLFIGALTCIGENAEIGDYTQLRAGAKIGDNVKIGKNCVLHPNVFIEDG